MQPEQRAYTNQKKCIIAPGNNQLADFGNLLPSCRTGAAWLNSDATEWERISVHPKVNRNSSMTGCRAVKYAEVVLSHWDSQGW